MLVPHLESPAWQAIDNVVYGTISFLFAGKAYAIFSLLFGLDLLLFLQIPDIVSFVSLLSGHALF